MRVHPAHKIRELLFLRRKGYSINDLVLKTGLPKTTVWHHVHRLSLSPKLQRELRSRQGGSKKRKEQNVIRASSTAKSLLSGGDRELAVVISMLYWAEGSKKVCEFINSDGRMLTVYLYILRTVLKIPEENIKPTMRIYSGMNRLECLNYWSSTTNIPKDRFLVRLNDGGTRGRVKYGMCRITVVKGAQTLKIFHSLIDKIYSGIVSV